MDYLIGNAFKLALAVSHLRDLMTRSISNEAERGHAVTEEDFSARLYIFKTVIRRYKDGLLGRFAVSDFSGTFQQFNDFMDGRKSFCETHTALYTKLDPTREDDYDFETYDTVQQLLDAYQFQYTQFPAGCLLMQ